MKISIPDMLFYGIGAAFAYSDKFLAVHEKSFPGDLFDMIHIYDAAPVAGKKAFHSVKNLLKFLESHVRSYDTGIGCMYLNGVAVSIHIENAAYRNLYRSSVRNQFDVSGIL